MHKRIWGSIRRPNSTDASEKAIADGDSPEASVARGVRLFCESGGPNNSGEEVLHLPAIVEAAESSPAAAAHAASEIQKFLSKSNYQRPYLQYNAIMLVRILADNPGTSFTKNIDSKFVSTVKDLLRDGRDMSVQQILRETLDAFETQKANDETLTGVRDMWKKEKVKMEKRGSMAQSPLPRSNTAPAFHSQQQNYFARNHHPKGLPSPIELAQRVEEAKTSAKLLSQVVQSTPPSELKSNDLIKEFVDRCNSASRSMQSYIHADNPAPDEDTLLTLIETNDQLAMAISKHQRAILQARREEGNSPNPLAKSSPYTPPAPAASTSHSLSLVPPVHPNQPNDNANPFDDTNTPNRPLSYDRKPPPGTLQAPLIPQNHTEGPNLSNGKMPSQGYVTNISYHGGFPGAVDGMYEAPPQAEKPRYRF